MAQEYYVYINLGNSDVDGIGLELYRRIKNKKEKRLLTFSFMTLLLAKKIAKYSSGEIGATDKINDVQIILDFVGFGKITFRYDGKVSKDVYRFSSKEGEFVKVIKKIIVARLPKTLKTLRAFDIDEQDLVRGYLKFVKPVFYVKYKDKKIFGDKERNLANYENLSDNINDFLNIYK